MTQQIESRTSEYTLLYEKDTKETKNRPMETTPFGKIMGHN